MGIRLETLTYSPFGVNTYLIIDDQNQCIIVDPACYGKEEEDHLIDFLKKDDLKPIKIINTHGHLDHIFGNNFVKRTFNIPLLAHKDSVYFIIQSPKQAQMYGLEMEEQIEPDDYLSEAETINFGGRELEIFYTPGHVDGSICIYCSSCGWVIAGDVLFQSSIGRTDLPTGNFELLSESIHTKLYTLPEATIVYPGHGPETSVGFEKENNPFVNTRN